MRQIDLATDRIAAARARIEAAKAELKEAGFTYEQIAAWVSGSAIERLSKLEMRDQNAGGIGGAENTAANASVMHLESDGTKFSDTEQQDASMSAISSIAPETKAPEFTNDEQPRVLGTGTAK